MLLNRVVSRVSAKNLAFIVLKKPQNPHIGKNGFPKSENLDSGSPLDWAQDFRGSTSPSSSLDKVFG